MAFNYENPHDDPNYGNYDWLCQEQRRIEDKVESYKDELDLKNEQQDGAINQVRTDMNQAIADVRTDMNAADQILDDKIDAIGDHVATYTQTYITENINEILANNPTIETKYEKIGYIDTNEYVDYTLDDDVIYEIMTIDYALNMHKALAVNNAFNVIQTPPSTAEVVTSIVVEKANVPVVTPIFEAVTNVTAGTDPIPVIENSLISGSAADNVLRITNNGTNKVRVYIKPIAAL